MAPVVLYAGREAQRDLYARHLRAAFAEAGLDVRLVMDAAEVDPAEVDYLVHTANGPVRDFAPFTRLRAVLALWAGVEGILALSPPADVPLVRMIEPGLTLGMIDYVAGHVLRHHLDIDRYIGTDPIAEWETSYPPLAGDRVVGVLGLGALGRPVAEADDHGLPLASNAPKNPLRKEIAKLAASLHELAVGAAADG